MKKMHKRICLFLALLMTASLFAGCGDAAGDETTVDTAAEVVETEAETDELEARKAIPDDLPDMDFGGYGFRRI